MRVHTVKGSFPKPGGDEVCVIESQESSVGRENRIDNNPFCRRDFTRLRAVNFRDEQVVAGGVGDHFAIRRRPGIHCLNVTDTMWRTAEDREAPQRTYGRNSVCVGRQKLRTVRREGQWPHVWRRKNRRFSWLASRDRHFLHALVFRASSIKVESRSIRPDNPLWQAVLR